jgi:hypothetical protein
MTAEFLSILAGSLLALLFAYLPGLSDWYEGLGNGQPADSGTRKRLVMLACLALTACASYGLACSGWGHYFGLSLSCSQAGAAELLRAFLLALAANQSTHRICPRLTNR